MSLRKLDLLADLVRTADKEKNLVITCKARLKTVGERHSNLTDTFGDLGRNHWILQTLMMI